MSLLRTPGAFWCGIAPLPHGAVAWCGVVDRTVLCESVTPDGQRRLLWETTLPEPLLELACASSPNGTVRVLVKGNSSGRAYEVSPAGVISHGPAFGVQSVAVCWAFDRFLAYVFRDPHHYSRIDLGTDVDSLEAYPGDPDGTSQGFLDAVDGQIVFADLARTVTRAGLTLTLPQTRDRVTVGQLDDSTHPAQIAGVLPLSPLGALVPFCAIAGEGFEPRLAALTDGRYAVCARTPQGATLVLLPPWPPLLTRNVAPPPTPPPLPPPPLPLPKEPPMSSGITDAQFASLQRVRATYPEVLSPWQGGDLINRWTYLHRAEGLGMQKKPSGTHAIQPQTGIGVWNGVRGRSDDGSHWGQDVFGGASVGLYTPTRGEVGPADPSTFVAPVDPGGGTAGGGGTQPPPPQPPPAQPPPPPADPRLPSPAQWQDHDYRQVEQSRRTFLGDPNWYPSAEWVIFVTLRVFVSGWSTARSIAWEANPTAGNLAGDREL